ncbi:MAG: hypothetical protein ACI4SL_02580, partial [Candidatus Ornithospirochaeta sp.]
MRTIRYYLLFLLLFFFLLASCTSTDSNASNWRRVEEISPTTFESIAPDGFTSSPIIDIETLKIIEGIDSLNAKSITMLQEERKDEISTKINNGEKIVDQSLS